MKKAKIKVIFIAVALGVELPVWPIPPRLTVEWCLDRCRTMINVLGEMNVACLFDGKSNEFRSETRER